MVLMSLVKSPIARSFLFGEHKRCRRIVGMPLCSMADTGANRLTARLFLPAAKTSRWNREHCEAEHCEKWIGRELRGHDSCLAPQNICTACDSRLPPRPRLALSRTAQRGFFALWVFHLSAIGPALAVNRQLVAALPGGRIASTADHAQAWL